MIITNRYVRFYSGFILGLLLGVAVSVMWMRILINGYNARILHMEMEREMLQTLIIEEMS
jgi:hypothetical protein